MVKKVAKRYSCVKSAFWIGLKVFTAKLFPGLCVAPCKKMRFSQPIGTHLMINPFLFLVGFVASVNYC
jgi:hypothetical protein